jgi:hypothetical protein
MAVSKKVDYSEYLSIREAAQKSGYSISHLRRLAASRRLKAKKVLGLWLIELDSQVKCR